VRRDSHGRDAGGNLGPEEVDDGVKAGKRVQLQLGHRLLQHREEPTGGAHGCHRRHGRPHAAAQRMPRVWRCRHESAPRVSLG
jgi:hypothetical protein